MTDKPDISDIENEILIEHCLDVFHNNEPDLSKPYEVKQCIDNYFQSCIEKNIRPGNMGLYASLGLEKREVQHLLDGTQRKNATPESIAHIKRACKAISLYREALGSAGKLNPATLIFWQKNYDGLEDVQRVDVAPVNTLTADKTPEQIASEIPVDDV